MSELALDTASANNLPRGDAPDGAAFWFVMPIALLAGGIMAYPMNWWLVAYHLKHGMMTIRRSETSEAIIREATPETVMVKNAISNVHDAKPSTVRIVKMAILSIAIFGVGIAVSVIFFQHR